MKWLSLPLFLWLAIFIPFHFGKWLDIGWFFAIAVALALPWWRAASMLFLLALLQDANLGLTYGTHCLWYGVALAIVHLGERYFQSRWLPSLYLFFGPLIWHTLLGYFFFSYLSLGAALSEVLILATFTWLLSPLLSPITHTLAQLFTPSESPHLLEESPQGYLRFLALLQEKNWKQEELHLTSSSASINPLK